MLTAKAIQEVFPPKQTLYPFVVSRIAIRHYCTEYPLLNVTQVLNRDDLRWLCDIYGFQIVFSMQLQGIKKKKLYVVW